MQTLFVILAASVCATVAYFQVYVFLSDSLFRVRDVFSAWRPVHLPLGAGLSAVTLAAAWGLYQTVPVLRWGWWEILVIPGLRGQPFLEIVTVGLGLLALPALPTLAQYAEVVFRSGTQGGSRTDTLSRAMAYGFAHSILGVPLAMSVAAVIPAVVLTVVHRAAYRAWWSRKLPITYAPRTGRHRARARAHGGTHGAAHGLVRGGVCCAPDEGVHHAVNTSAAVSTTYMAITVCTVMVAAAVRVAS